MALTYEYITTEDETQVKSGAGILHKVVVNTPVATGVIGLVDNTSGTTVNIGEIVSTADLKPYEIVYDCRFSTGLRVVTTVAAQDITIIYQ
jgi:hypothetical protein